MIVTDAFFDGRVVAMLKPLLLVPAATTTLAGTDAIDDFELVSVTVTPPAGAGPESVTVPATEPPPRIDVGLIVTPDNATGGADGLTVTVVVFVTPA